jgi:hypothetical protein
MNQINSQLEGLFVPPEAEAQATEQEEDEQVAIIF